MKSQLALVASLMAAIISGHSVGNSRHVRNAPTDLPRLGVYFQTTHDPEGNPVSMLPLINEEGIALTHILISSLHINKGGEVHLNNAPPSDPLFYTLWNETVLMKNAGVKVMGMVGGSAPGAFTNETLDGDQATFDHYYGQLRDVIKQQELQGMDLDVEEFMSQDGITRLVNALYDDFGPGFEITLAPVGFAMSFGDGFGPSGFSYQTLEKDVGDKIHFYNVQFYNGYQEMTYPVFFEECVGQGYAPTKLVAGQLTSPDDGSDYHAPSEINSTIATLQKEYGQIGGVVGWEYFNSLPGNTSAPWEWAQEMTQILRPNQVPQIKVTRQDAERLTDAYGESTKHSDKKNKQAVRVKVDYFKMINA